jgi:hypothetical protein
LPEEEIVKARESGGDSWVGVSAGFRLAMIRGQYTFDLTPVEGVSVKFTSVRQFIEKWWGPNSPEK